MLTYKKGDREFRPWGYFKVLDCGYLPDGREFCEKLLVIAPCKILSLQAHDFREETWTVQTGSLTAIRGWRRHRLSPGSSIKIPSRAIHTIANLENTLLILHERQTGICREDDIIRYADTHGRAQPAAGPAWLFLSQRLYKNMIKEIRNTSFKQQA